MHSKRGASITPSLAAHAETGRHYDAAVVVGDELGLASPPSRHVRISKDRIDRFANALPSSASGGSGV
jgi:hypothetical protein